MSTTKTPSKIAIFPGSFDPIHKGHLTMASIVSETHDLVYLVPSGRSPNKANQNQTPSGVRADWIASCLKNPHWSAKGKIQLCRIESNQNRRTYTLDTLRALSELHPKAQLSLVCGADTAERIQRWPTKDKVFQMASLFSFARNGADGTNPTRIPAISSSLVRAEAAQGNMIANLVPSEILGEILDTFGPRDTESHATKTWEKIRSFQAQEKHGEAAKLSIELQAFLHFRHEKSLKTEKIEALTQEILENAEI